ncbi:MAG: hypothetical protein AB7U20_08280 [Planctomycetaceae bacterium]
MTDPDRLDWEPYDRHWIRLRGPWEVAWMTPPLDDAARSEVASGKIRLPAEWRDLFGHRVGTARFSRRFQRPTNLDDEERVIVTLCEVRCAATAKLNGLPLIPLAIPIGDPASAPSEEALSFDITGQMLATNQLELELTVTTTELTTGACGLWKPVFLEIIAPD